MSNKALFQVIRYSVMPKSIEQVNDILYQSVWPPRSYKFFQDEANILRKPKNYMYEYIAYKKNFQDMLDLLKPAYEKDLMPRYVMAKANHRSLVGIMLEGTPNSKFAKQIMLRGIPEDKRNESLTWEQFNYHYELALREWVQDLEKSKDAMRRYTVSSEARKMKPPLEVEKEEKRASRDAGNSSLYGMDGMPHLMDDSDDEEPWETAASRQGNPEVTGDEYEGGYDTAPEEETSADEFQEDMKHEEEELLNEVEEELGEDGWLCAVEGKSGKRVCWQFAKTGKCGWLEKSGKCTFSHEPEDIALWKALNAAGKDGVKSGYKAAHVKFAPTKAGSATSPGPHSTPVGRVSQTGGRGGHSNSQRPQMYATSKSGRMKRG